MVPSAVAAVDKSRLILGGNKMIETNVEIDDEEYWEYLYHLAEIMQMEEKYQDEDESASFCEAKVHLSGS